jgi:hypothetical protein
LPYLKVEHEESGRITLIGEENTPNYVIEPRTSKHIQTSKKSYVNCAIFKAPQRSCLDADRKLQSDRKNVKKKRENCKQGFVKYA